MRENTRNQMNSPDRSGEKRNKNEAARKWLRLLFEIAVTLAFAGLVAVGMFQSVTMQESAMEPTLSVGDRFFINRVVYRFQEPKSGDIIVFKTNASDDAALHVQRIIAVPGETIQIVNGRVRINGSFLQEQEDFPSITNPGLATNAITLQNGEYFVLGDNRNNSEDSRYGDIGLVKKKYIVGKLWFRLSTERASGFLKG